MSSKGRAVMMYVETFKTDVIVLSVLNVINVTSPGLTKPGRSGRLLRPGFNEVAQFLSKSEVLVALSVFSSPYLFHQYSYFFFNIHIKGAPMFLKCDPYRVWCSIFYSKLVNCTLLDHCSFLWKVEEHAVAGKETFKIWIDFRKSPRFSFTSSLSQEREKSSRPVFTMCGEPCITLTNVFQYQGY